MTRTLFLAALFMLSGTSTAGAPQSGGAFGVLTVQVPGHAPFVDSGVVRRVHIEPSNIAPYYRLVVEFPDHLDYIHYEDGADIVWR